MFKAFILALSASLLVHTGAAPSHQPLIASAVGDIVAVAFDSSEQPVFAGASGRVRTAALLASIASFESGGFDPKVDSGERKGDGGKSYCMMQINLGTRRIVLAPKGYRYSYSEGLTGADLLADRRACVRAALHVAQASYASCGNLSGYTSGKCSPAEPAAVAREGLAKRIIGQWTDIDVKPEPLGAL